MDLDPIQPPRVRPRRLRLNPLVRDMVRETRLHADQLVLPLFVSAVAKGRCPVASMPGVAQTDVDELCRDVEGALKDGVRRVILFGVPGEKDGQGRDAYAADGIVQQVLGRLRKQFGSDVLLMADTCLCQFTDHGHCGVVREGSAEGVVNDETLALLRTTAVSQAAAGADLVAPSGMIDGMVANIRDALDEAGHAHVGILSYAVKYASALYGPFRDAAESTPSHGDRRGQQMDPANAREAIREALLDEEEGADLLMVKPALAYLDILQRLSTVTTLPLAAYLVSGEYSMMKAAAEKGWIDERAVVLEIHTALTRSGASVLLTYYARDIARWLQQG